MGGFFISFIATLAFEGDSNFFTNAFTIRRREYVDTKIRRQKLEMRWERLLPRRNQSIRTS